MGSGVQRFVGHVPVSFIRDAYVRPCGFSTARSEVTTHPRRVVVVYASFSMPLGEHLLLAFALKTLLRESTGARSAASPLAETITTC